MRLAGLSKFALNLQPLIAACNMLQDWQGCSSRDGSSGTTYWSSYMPSMAFPFCCVEPGLLEAQFTSSSGSAWALFGIQYYRMLLNSLDAKDSQTVSSAKAPSHPNHVKCSNTKDCACQTMKPLINHGRKCLPSKQCQASKGHLAIKQRQMIVPELNYPQAAL